MTEFFEMLAPGMKHWRQKQDLDQTLVVEVPSGDPDHGQSVIDLDRGTATIVTPLTSASSARPRRRQSGPNPRS